MCGGYALQIPCVYDHGIHVVPQSPLRVVWGRGTEILVFLEPLQEGVLAIGVLGGEKIYLSKELLCSDLKVWVARDKETREIATDLDGSGGPILDAVE